MSEHEHTWKLHAHIDGCHWYASSYLCECGAQRVAKDERSIEHDPYSMVWFDEECTRCSQLAGGAKPEHSDDIYVTDAA